MKGNWFKRFSDKGSLEMDGDKYLEAYNAVSSDMPVYMTYLEEGDKVLEAACGPGYTAIPLSHYFKVTAFDREPAILEAACRNAERFGGDIRFVEADFNDITDVFGGDSFQAVSSGGVLEHYPVEDVRRLVDLQLKVAPIVFIQIPLFTLQEAGEVNDYGIETYHYTRREWLEEILEDFNIHEYRQIPRPTSGRFREFTVVLGR